VATATAVAASLDSLASSYTVAPEPARMSTSTAEAR